MQTVVDLPIIYFLTTHTYVSWLICKLCYSKSLYKYLFNRMDIGSFILHYMQEKLFPSLQAHVKNN